MGNWMPTTGGNSGLVVFNPSRNRDDDNVNTMMEVLGTAELIEVWDRAKELHLDASGSPMGCLNQALCEHLEVDDLSATKVGFRHPLRDAVAEGRAETDSCERGTPGCCIHHTTDSSCETW